MIDVYTAAAQQGGFLFSHPQETISCLPLVIDNNYKAASCYNFKCNFFIISLHLSLQHE
jgi:hypothetical protein